MAAFFTLLNESDGVERLKDSIKYLLYGPGEIWVRLDECLVGSRQLRGVKASILTKILSFRFPEEWIPVFPNKGKLGLKQANV